MSDYKVVGEVLVPIEPPAPVRPATNALVVEPESDSEVEIADGQATLFAPDADTGAYVVRLRPSTRPN
jgi:hypothetical protein